MDWERLQYDEKEVLSLWEKVQSEPTFLQAQNPSFTESTSLKNGTKPKLLHKGSALQTCSGKCLIMIIFNDITPRTDSIQPFHHFFHLDFPLVFY